MCLIKKDLEQLISIRFEVEHLSSEIINLKTRVIADSVEGSSPEFPYTKHRIMIGGIDTGRLEKLRTKLETKLDELQDILLRTEESIESIKDSEMRNILRQYYRNGLTQKQIGDELGYERSTVCRKIKEFLKGFGDEEK
jgi:DNA-directed RNA polymerase specialized sigma subunit